MIGCLRTRVRKQLIIALYFESETVLKFYNLEARIWGRLSGRAYGDPICSPKLLIAVGAKFDDKAHVYSYI